MTLFLHPTYERIDELIEAAVTRRQHSAAGRHAGPRAALALSELVPDDGSSYSPYTGAEHFGKVNRQIMRLVYELDVHGGSGTHPPDLGPKHHWVVDVHVPVTMQTRTGYLAVTTNGEQAVLIPLPELPPTLLDGTGELEDTRAALRGFADQISDLVNLALPAARGLAMKVG